jgi:hypothetical protein
VLSGCSVTNDLGLRQLVEDPWQIDQTIKIPLFYGFLIPNLSAILIEYCDKDNLEPTDPFWKAHMKAGGQISLTTLGLSTLKTEIFKAVGRECNIEPGLVETRLTDGVGESPCLYFVRTIPLEHGVEEAPNAPAIPRLADALGVINRVLGRHGLEADVQMSDLQWYKGIGALW